MKIGATALGCMLTALLAASGCDRAAPTSPPAPVPVLSVSQASVSLARTTTAAVTATSTLGGVGSDVTAVATWRSSNPQVATVAAGVITAVGPGSATITAEYSGQTQTVSVSVRRRVYLRVVLVITDLAGRSSLKAQTSYIDDQYTANSGTSSPDPRIRAYIGAYRGIGVVLAPGDHVLSVQLKNSGGDYAFDFETAANVLDFDTDESVGTLTLPNRRETLGPDAVVTWTFTVGAYTS